MFKMPNSDQQNPCLSTIAVAALVGGLVGAFVGLMVAPKSGRALRQGIQEKTDDVIERVGDVTFYHTESLKSQGADLAGKGMKLADDLQTFIQESLRSKNVDTEIVQSEEFTQPSEADESYVVDPPLQDK